MNKWQLFKALRKHRKLAERRAMNFEQNKTAKFVVYLMSSLLLVYLISFAIILSLVANDSTRVTALEFIMGISPFIFLIDFVMRFLMQQTPSQIIKPYTLLLIPKYTCIDSFIGTSLITSGNLIWFALFVPYCIMSVLFSYGIPATLSLLFLLWLMVLVNSQWYLIVRTLVIDSMAWWLLPIAVYALIAAPLYIGTHSGFSSFFDFWSSSGTMIESGNPLPFLVVLALLAALILINRRLQYHHTWRELSRTKRIKLHRVSQFRFLELFGEQGEFLKLEIKTIMRNKNPRKGFITATALVLVLSIVIAFTEVYDSQFMTNFWCVYNFVIYGATMLIKIMCNEGNYIDALLVRRENILSLLHAKYRFSCAMLLLPFILMLPTVFTGKWSLLMLFSYAVFTAGFQYFILFQMAVYNKQTIPLNTKFISRAGVENNYFQFAASMIVFFVPIIFVSVIQTIAGQTTSYIILLLLGLAFILTHHIWLRNIYNRMMKRRYSTLEAFRASR